MSGAEPATSSTAPRPADAVTPTTPTGASKWSDAKIATSILASAELDLVLTQAQLANLIDANGFVNLQHTTPTNLTLQIVGPF